jgi:hypothetical protein
MIVAAGAMEQQPDAVSASGCVRQYPVERTGGSRHPRDAESRACYFLDGGVKNGDGVADALFLSFLGFFTSRLLFF